jgi:hypothetical protein|tara:strand:- start:4740 stop:4949 length:210 start_codon:yes stop_codon:yes gene_type:complete
MKTNIKITKWELSLIWSLIVYAIIMLTKDVEKELSNDLNFLLLFGIPLVVAEFYIFWIYPLSIIFRDKK